MANFRQSVGNTVKRVACSIVDTAAKRDDLWERAKKGNPFVGIGQAEDDGFTLPIARLICGDREPGPQPDLPDFTPGSPPPFTGGQCGDRYAFTFERTRADGLVSEQDPIVYWGPLGALRIIPSGPNGSTIQILAHGIWNGPRQSAQTYHNLATGLNTIWTEARIYNVRKMFPEGPDECGDLPRGPGDWEPEPVEVCYDLPDGTEVCETPTIKPKPPIIGPGSEFEWPFELDFGDGPFNVKYKPGTGDVEFDEPGGLPSGNACCPPVDPAGPAAPPGDDDPDEPEDNRRFIGVVVNCVVSPTCSVTELSGGDVSLFIPRIATISLAIQIGENNAWTDDVAIRKKKQYVAVPDTGIGYAWTVYNEPGVSSTVTPIYIEETS